MCGWQLGRRNSCTTLHAAQLCIMCPCRVLMRQNTTEGKYMQRTGGGGERPWAFAKYLQWLESTSEQSSPLFFGGGGGKWLRPKHHSGKKVVCVLSGFFFLFLLGIQCKIVSASTIKLIVKNEIVYPKLFALNQLIGPQVDMQMHFRIWLQFHGNIRIESSNFYAQIKPY